MPNTWPRTTDVLFAARLCGWPARTIGGRVLRGEADWRAVDARMTTADRAATLHDLGRRELLVATPGGRHRLRAWLNRRWAGSWEPEPALRFYGDEAMLPAVEHALSQLPAPVRNLVASACYIVAVGGRLRGWTSAPLATAGLSPIVVSGAELETLAEVTVHEAAHRWHARPLPAEVTAPTHAEQAALLSHARAEGWPLAAAEARKADDERLAKLCALAWSAA